MNAGLLKKQVMFQTGNDAEDLGDFQPHLMDYLNEGYDRMIFALTGEHPHMGGGVEPFWNDRCEPLLPEWAQRALADYATWMVYRNGTPQRQNRGMVFKKCFDEAVDRLRREKAGKRFINLPE